MRVRFFLDTTEKREKPEGETKPSLWPSAFRLATILLLLATIWFVAGSLIYPMWWFELIFKRGFFNWPLFQYGFTYLLHHETWLLIALPTLALALAFAIWRSWNRACRVLDRFGVYILALCVVSSSIDAYCLNRTQRFKYEVFSGLFKITDSLTQAVIVLTELGLPPSRITPPVNFLYVDKDRIGMLYIQLQPALTEKKRTITSESKSDSGLDLERKPLTLKLGGSTENGETREYQSVDPSTTRQCLDVMNGLLARQFPPYYATFEGLSSFQLLTEVKETMKSVRESLPHQTLFTEEKVPERNVATLKQMVEIRQKTPPAVIEEGIRTQLKALSGLVIVQGNFKRGSDVGEFREQFKGNPRPVFFHFVLRDKEAVRLLPDDGKRMVLGDVIRKWDGGSSIEIYPIAIF